MSTAIVHSSIIEFFRDIYEKIEVEKLNKMSYLKYCISLIYRSYLIEHCRKIWNLRVQKSRFLIVYLLLFFNNKKAHPGFLICCTVFNSLQNGIKISTKKSGVSGDITLTLLVVVVANSIIVVRYQANLLVYFILNYTLWYINKKGILRLTFYE